MEREIKNFIKVWILVLSALIYCYFIVSKIPKGKLRFLTLLPIFYLFIILPLNLHSFHIGFFTALYITWLANFKLLLFSFNQGPLSSSPSNQPKPLLHFIFIACLPIITKDNPSLQVQSPHDQNIKQTKQNSSLLSPQNIKMSTKSVRNVVLKALLLYLLVSIYDYLPYVNLKTYMIWTYYNLLFYLTVRLVYALSELPARAILGLELEPQFNQPLLSTSLRDFWGRRWNRPASNILRSTISHPIRSVATPIFGRVWAHLIGVVFAFTVSGLMHELVYYYVTRVNPTWEVTLYFVFQGFCYVLELESKRRLTAGKWRLHPWVSMPLTLLFNWVTTYWLGSPQLLRNGVYEGAIKEYRLAFEFVKEKIAKLSLFSK